MSPQKLINKDVLQLASARFMDMELNGVNMFAVSPNCDPKKPPTWYEPEIFRHAQKLFRTYGYILFVSNTYGMLVMFFCLNVLGPVLATTHSRTVKSFFIRYFSTFLHFRNWTRYDPFEPSSESYKSIKEVRGYHRQTCTKLNKAANLKKNENVLWISNSAIAKEQFALVGLMTLFPKELGFHNFTLKDVHSIYHFWRVIGYCIGIDDRFNMCAGSDEEIAVLCKMYYDLEIKPNVTKQNENSIKFNKTLCFSLSRLNPLCNYNVLFHYFAPCLEMKRSQFLLVGFVEKLYYVIFKFIMQHASKSVIINWIFTTGQNVIVDMAVKLFPLIEWYFDRNHNEVQLKADERCPFDIKLNYKPKFGNLN